METTQQSLHFYSNHQTQLSLDLLIESLGASPDGFQSIKGDKSLDWAFCCCCFVVLVCAQMCMFVHVQVVCSPKPSMKQFGHYVGLLLWVSEGDLVQNMHGSVRTLIAHAANTQKRQKG